MQKSKKPVLSKLMSGRGSITRNTVTTNALINVNEEAQLKSWKAIPGPPSHPIIDQMLQFIFGGTKSNSNNYQENLYNKYGPIVRVDGSLVQKTTLHLFDADSCAQILRGENWLPERLGFESLEYYRKKYNKSKEESKLPTGLVTEQGENWRSFRIKVNPVMLQPKTIKLYSPLVDEVALDMIKRMKSIRDENNKLKGSFNTEMNLWALESIGVIALGGRLNCLDENLPEDSPQRKLIQCVYDIFRINYKLDYQSNLWRYYPTKLFKEGMKVYKEQENLAEYFINKARKEILATKKPDHEKGVLEKLLEIDERVAVIMACDMMFGGVDTTAITVTATLYLLAKNQDKQNKLRESLKSKDDSRKYLKACLKESMRILPVASGNTRITTKEYSILGYKIPKGMYIVFNHMILSRMDSQFPRAKEYIPERWIEQGELSHKNAHSFAFSPFGFGVRMCVGRRIAELEIETFVARVIENFKVEWTGPPPTIRPETLNYIDGPFNFTFKDV